MNRIKSILKWFVLLILSFGVILTSTFFYLVHKSSKENLTIELKAEIIKLKNKSNILPELFYVLYDLNSPNSTINSPYQQLVKGIIYDKSESCSCIDLARMFSYKSVRNGLQNGIKNIAIGNYLYEEFKGRACLDMLLTRFDFVNNQIGIENAAHFYFNKPINDLSIDETGTLVILIRNPSYFNPIRRPEFVKEATDQLIKKYENNLL